MNNFTTNCYEMKREIVNFSKKITENCTKPEKKFILDMIFGIFKSKNILLSCIAEALNEKTKKAFVINRLSDNLANDLTEDLDKNYCNLAMKSLGNEPIFLIDDSDVIKPLGKRFENLGYVKDGSSKDKKIEKGYRVSELVGLTKEMKQPISLFSKVHSSVQKDYSSTNSITFEGIDKVTKLLNEREQVGTFILDRGYDSNSIINYFFEKKQYFVIRLKENRKVYLNHKWYKISTIRDSKKGKRKMKVMFQGEEKECYVSVVKVQITANKKWVNLIIIYGLGKTPMMVITNKKIRCKEEAIKSARLYINRWRIEEYFKFKKQEYNFEDFRVRTLKSINNLNKMLTYTIGMIALLSEKRKEICL